MHIRKIAVFFALVLGIGLQAQAPLGSGWTYQGLLKLSGDPLNDTADFEFRLWDADVDGNMIGEVVAVEDVDVVDGLFTVEIDFGVEAFDGNNRWLRIDVRSPAGGGAFTTLDPRQPLTVAPYALQTRGIFVDDPGNVGIGTTAPSHTLTVQNTSDPDTMRLIGRGSFGSGARLNFGDGNQVYLYEVSDDRLEIRATQGMRLFANVGINVNEPLNSLDVSGGAVIGSANFAGVETAPQFGLLVEGNVGIGTTTPTEALQVAGTVVAEALEVAGIVAADAFQGDGSGLSGLVGFAGSTVDLDNVATLRWDLLNRTFPVGSGPQGVAFDGANIWVANINDDTVTKLRASDGADLGTFPVGARPVAVAFDGANIWVTNEGGDNVTRISLVK